MGSTTIDALTQAFNNALSANIANLLAIGAILTILVIGLLALITWRVWHSGRNYRERQTGAFEKIALLAERTEKKLTDGFDSLRNDQDAHFARLYEQIASLPDAVRSRIEPDFNRFMGEQERFLKAVTGALRDNGFRIVHDSAGAPRKPGLLSRIFSSL